MLQNIIISLSLSALIATEFSFIAHIVLAALYIALFVTKKINNIFAIFLGIANYFLQIFSGGFIAGILFSLSSDVDIKHISIIAGLLMIFSCIFLTIFKTDGPFKIAWWFDVVLCLLVKVTCKTFLTIPPFK